jgi:peptide/nickel transport system permease protein
MLFYIIRRALYAIPILAGVALLTFFLFYMIYTPEQMARKNLSAKNPTKTQIHQWVVAHGYDKPRSVQFCEYIENMFEFKFGKSDTSGEPISDILKSGVVPSFQVASLIFFAAVVVDICFALFFAYFRGTYVDHWGRFICVMMMSITYVVYIIVGQFVFGKLLKLYPLAGYHSGLDSWRFVLLPALVGLISGFGSDVRLYRTLILEEIGQDYVRTARAKGVAESTILFSHVLKNAAIPILTTIVSQIPLLLLGSILLESFFGIPGVGNITYEAINNQDFSIVRTVVFLGAILYIVGYILTDISYALADPRVRLE